MIGTMKKISVIIPIYNAEKYLDSCIQSVLNQTYSMWELILIDDGSTDQSGAIADKYERIEKRVRVVHKENAGVSNARNQGLDIAKGEYVAFLDADDELTQDCLEKMLTIAIDEQADIVAGRSSDDAVLDNRMTIWRGKTALKNSLMDNPFTYSSCAKLIRKSCIGETRFIPEIKINEDSYFVFQLLCKEPVFVGTEDKVYLYRNNPESASRAVFSEKFFDILRVADLKYETIQKQFPEMLGLAKNMQLKAKMNLLYILANRTVNEYHELEKKLILWVQKNKKYYIPATKHDTKWMFVLSNHLYFAYKVIKCPQLIFCNLQKTD